jgi:hypothetical protein
MTSEAIEFHSTNIDKRKNNKNTNNRSFYRSLFRRLFITNDRYKELISANIIILITSYYLNSILEETFKKKIFDKYDQRRDKKKYLMTYLILK